MNLISGQTINDIVFKAMQTLLTEGLRTSSRNGDIFALYNTFFTLTNPRSRHLHLKGRKNNIFAMIAETMWVLAGDDVLDPYVSFFLPRAHDFSDDDKTWRGGYGPRLYTYNQLEDAVRVFEEEGMQSRRSVIAIYLPELDTKEQLQAVYGLTNTKDRPCNNMIHFFITPDKTLHMNVYQRSGDVIWGMGSINIFEWTVLQEFVCSEVQRRVDKDIQLGTYNHFVTNLHLYDFTGKQAYDVVKLEYEQVFDRVNTSRLTFPEGVEKNRRFFARLVGVYSKAIERKETDYSTLFKEVVPVFDEFLTKPHETNLLYAYAQVVAAYICAKNGNADVVLDLTAFSEEFRECVATSSFRKFHLAGYADK